MWYEILSNFKGNSFYLARNDQIAALFGIIVLVVALYVFRDKGKKKLPPGPIGLPILGYYPFLGKQPEKTFHELGKKYGNVVGVYIGRQFTVLLNDWGAMIDAYSQSATVDRPESTFQNAPYKLGMVGASGEEWIQARRLSSRAMKDIGLNNTKWEQVVEEEIAEVIKHITQHGDHPLDVKTFLRDTFANNIVTLVIGKRLPFGHPFTTSVAKSSDAIIENTPTLAISNFSSTLSKLFQVFGLQKDLVLVETVDEFSKAMSNAVDDALQNPGAERDDSFIVRFQEQIQNHKKLKETYITEDTIKGTVIALIVGGSETSRCTIIFTLIAMAENQDIQRKVHEELDRVIGKEGSIRWPERFKIPYTYATLLESTRWATVVPFTTMRIAAEDIEIQGFHIPKGTFISANNYSIHNDPRYWKDPRQFRPERFLTEDGRKVNSAPESYNPFSYGKRNCPGKLMALMEVLQYFCILMQNFKVVPKEGDKVKHGMLRGLTYQATGVELRFIPRK